MAGDDFIIGMTISGGEPYPGGLSLADKQEIVSWLDQRGLIDYYSCGTGSYVNQSSKSVPSFHFGMFLGRVTGIEWFNGLGEAVTVVIGLIFVVCVMAFRRGLVGEFNAWWAHRQSARAAGAA